MGLEPVVAPLFAVRPIPAPPADPAAYDAILITSANGARYAPAGFAALPCFVVGEASAAAAQSAGFADVRIGPSDGASAAAMMAAAGARRAIHLCGLDHVPLEEAGLHLDAHAVYASEPVPWQAIDGPAVAMVHSPRAAARFAALAGDRSRIAIAAISAAAAAAAGEGWAAKAVASAPRDSALLELANHLCNYAPEAAKDGGDGL
jgi:uroporphyrinogen-III synthase